MDRAQQERLKTDIALQNALLRSFLHSEFRGIVRPYDAGKSGAPVFAVRYKRIHLSGLDGIFIVKLGLKEWASREQVFSARFSSNLPSNIFTRVYISSNPVEEFAAVAYEVAFDSLTQSETLMNMFDKKIHSEEETWRMVQQLALALVEWYLQSEAEPVVEDLSQLLQRMLTEKRADLLTRLGTYFPAWSTDMLYIQVDGGKQRLPNPLAYKTIIEKIVFHPSYVAVFVHGDLHTGNIICIPESELTPKLIDFDQHVPDGVPLFDLAYLEFDIMCRVLPVEQQTNREAWLALLDGSMAGVRGNSPDSPWDAARAWKFIAPVRQEVYQLIKNHEEDYTTIWWLSIVAAGLNFARKGDDTRSLYERVAGLLYAAYGLDSLLKFFKIKELSTQKTVPVVAWVQGDFAALTGLETPLSAPDQEATLDQELFAEEQVPSAPLPVIPENGEIIPPPVQPGNAVEPGTAFPIKTETEWKESAAPPSPVVVAPEHDVTRALSVLERAERYSGQSANTLQNLLQIAVNTFSTGEPIFQDMCETSEQTLQQLTVFLEELRKCIPMYDFSNIFPLDNLLESKEQLLHKLREFRESCLPARSRKLAQALYDQEYLAVRNELGELQTAFRAFLEEIS